MRLQLITCKVMQREAYFCADRSKNIVDVVLMEQGLHDEPEKLRSEVQKALDNTCDIQGSPILMQKLVDGDWHKSEFLVIEPCRKISEDLTNDGIIKAE